MKMYSLIIVLSSLRAIELVSPMEVSLTSTLNERLLAYPKQEITFTCITRGSQILAWSSDDYIGRDFQLEFTSLHLPQYTIRSSINSDTIATLTNVNTENGIIMLESTLRIVVSSQFPLSSITCHHIASGQINSTTLHVAAEQAQEVSCTLRRGLYACPGDRLNFTCETRDSQVLAWSSDEYIGQNQHLEFLSIDTVGTARRSQVQPNTVAMLTSVYPENGVQVITCNLSITVLGSISHQGHSVICINGGVGTQNVTTFYLAENCDPNFLEKETTGEPQKTEFYIDVERTAAGINATPNSGLMLILFGFLSYWCHFRDDW